MCHGIGTGIKKIMTEVVKKPLPTRKFGISALLFYVIRGASSRFHSRAERVLRLLMDDSIFGIVDMNFLACISYFHFSISFYT
jgi:hypothetical protein